MRSGGPISRIQILLSLCVGVVFGFSAEGGFAQTWANSYDGRGPCGGYGNAKSIQQTGDGGFVFIGVIGNAIDNPNCGMDFRLTKLDASGVVEWSKILFHTYEGDTGALLETSDGGYLITGTVRSDAGGGSSACESDNVGLIKVDASGNVQWQRSYGLDVTLGQICRDNWEHGRGLADAGDGGYLVLGQRETNPLADTPVGQESQGVDLWLVKVDANGDLLWQKSYGGAGDERLAQPDLITVLDGGDIVIAGRTDSFGPNPNAILVVRLNPDGVIVWERVFGPDQGATPNSLLAIGDSVLIVARTDGFEPPGPSKIWLVALTGSGVIDWQRVIQHVNPPGVPSLQVFPFHVEQTSAGGFAIFGGMTVWGRWDSDPLLLNVDSTGGIDWALVYELSTSSEWAGAGDVTSDGGFVFGGFSPLEDDVMILRTDAVGAINRDFCDISSAPTLQSNITDEPIGVANLVTLTTSSPQWNESLTPEAHVEVVIDYCVPAAVIHVSANPLLFGDVPIGSTSTLILQVSNVGDNWFYIDSVVPPTGSEMTLVGEDCTEDQLDPGMSCTIEVNFAPTSVGWVFDQISIPFLDSDFVNQNVTVRLQGFGGTGGIFADGFESTDTALWSGTVP